MKHVEPSMNGGIINSVTKLHLVGVTFLIIKPTFFSVALRPNAGHGLLILEVSKSHTTTHHSR